MIDRNHIEQILRINGLTPTAADEEIRSVLISAKWQQDEVETALTVLRENKNTHESRVDTLHDVFLSDKHLSPEAIESLLGIKVEVDPKEMEHMHDRQRLVTLMQMLIIICSASIIALSSVLSIMYFGQFGVFHPEPDSFKNLKNF